MTIIEAIRTYLSDCPMLLNLGSRVKVDFLQEKGKSVSIEPLPVNPVAVKFPYSDEAAMNVENSGFFEEFADWLEEQNDLDHLPDLGEGKQATKIEVTSNGYLFGITQDMKYGRYQIQCRLLYEVE